MATWILTESGTLLKVECIQEIVIEADGDLFLIEAHCPDFGVELASQLTDTVVCAVMDLIAWDISPASTGTIKIRDLIQRAEEYLGIKPMAGVTHNGMPVWAGD